MKRSGFSGVYAACPRCRDEGKDSTGNHLSLFNDGTGGWCARSHGLVLFDKEDTGGSRQVEKKMDVAVVSHYPVRALEDRGISEETAQRFGVRCSIDETTGEPDAHYYPYHDMDGNVVGWKKRGLLRVE